MEVAVLALRELRPRSSGRNERQTPVAFQDVAPLHAARLVAAQPVLPLGRKAGAPKTFTVRAVIQQRKPSSKNEV